MFAARFSERLLAGMLSSPLRKACLVHAFFHAPVFLSGSIETCPPGPQRKRLVFRLHGFTAPVGHPCRFSLFLRFFIIKTNKIEISDNFFPFFPFFPLTAKGVFYK